MSTTYTLWTTMGQIGKKGPYTITGNNYRFNGQPNTADTVVLYVARVQFSAISSNQFQKVLSEN